MRVLKETYGEIPVTEWLKVKLKEFHEEKYGEMCEIICHAKDAEQQPAQGMRT